MPFKFWKREKRGKEKEGPPEEKAPPAEEKPPAPAEATKPVAEVPAPAAPAEKAKPEQIPEDLASVADTVHGVLVELGLTVPGTRPLFRTKVAAYPGGGDAFLSAYRSAPYRAVTGVLVDWLGLRVPREFAPAKLLEEVNLRLSSFRLSIGMSDLLWLDQDLGLRKARLRLGDQEKIVRFKDPRDFAKGINDLLAPRKLAFLELETWSSDDFAFLLTRDPKWDKLASTELVVVKAQETAVGGECGECGAPVGPHWHDCLACGAVFGSD